MKIPKIIELLENSDVILRQSLLAVRPIEGCALLIGNTKELKNSQGAISYQVQMIWPCCNIWEPSISFQKDIYKNQLFKLSKQNRFAIDPKEQIAAQKWARGKQWKILGSAHSHPQSNANPSQTDLYCAGKSGLSIIIDCSGDIKAWWIKDHQQFEEIEVIFNLKK
tara:strand:+ start:28636 stop:29133 length:498 start_codon:yes stop_codon:yes gene_type:complete